MLSVHICIAKFMEINVPSGAGVDAFSNADDAAFTEVLVFSLNTDKSVFEVSAKSKSYVCKLCCHI